MLKAAFRRIDKWIARVANWAGVLSLLGGGAILAALTSWAASSWEYLSQQGWGAVALVGVGAACLIVLSLSVGMIAWRYFYPLPQRAIEPTIVAQPAKPETPFAESLYVGDMHVGVAKLQTEQVIEISARGFNATGVEICFLGIRGNIKIDPVEGQPSLTLSPPAMEDRFMEERVGHLGEFIIAIEQRLPPDLANGILNLTATDKVYLNLQSLNILAAPSANANKTARLPLWGGITLSKDPAMPNISRIAYATARATL
jgi:hypothetical protein